jgi:CxxC motif-containing protein
MIKKMTCIQCPKGCSLAVDIENCRVVKVSGNLCPKGEEYAITEVENPRRILTATVLAQGLSLKMVPVRTDQPIPKAKMQEAAAEVKKIRVTKPLKAGDVLVADFLGLGVNLVATRTTTGP